LEGVYYACLGIHRLEQKREPSFRVIDRVGKHLPGDEVGHEYETIVLVVKVRVQVRCRFVRQPCWVALIWDALFVSKFRKTYLLVREMKANCDIVRRSTINIVLEAITDTFYFATCFVVRAFDILVHLLDRVVMNRREKRIAKLGNWSFIVLPFAKSSDVS